MAVSSQHPEYRAIHLRWLKMRHTYGGEDLVKEQGDLYLPPTSGMRADGMNQGQDGQSAYQAYKIRAVFPNYTSEAVRGLIGVMHNNPPMIELPPQMEPMRDRATVSRESLAMLLRRINEQQLITGRIGLMLDLQETPSLDSLPYVATYDAERIINWDDGRREQPVLQSLNLVVLNETENERLTNFEWREMIKYRVLVLGGVLPDEEVGLYRQGLYRDAGTDFTESELIIPEIRGRTLEEIPFVFVNSTDLLASPLNPPLLELANLCLTIYRGEADYRQNLYMQSQDTLVRIGADDTEKQRIGAGATIDIPQGGDAKFIGVSSTGLGEQRQALENDKNRASQIGSQLLDTTSRQKESGEALRIRVAAQTATLNQIALAGAEGLQELLRKAARWIGADDSKVTVRPNLEFAESGMTPADFLALQQGKDQGLPLSSESIHGLLKQNDLTQLTFEQELAKIGIDQKRAAVFQTLMTTGIGIQGAAAGAGIPDHIAARMMPASPPPQPQQGGQQ